MTSGFALTCPPALRHSTVQMAHGGGGRAMQQLIEQIFLPAFDNPALALRHDSAVLDALPGRLAVTTDSSVVRPLFFPGGDIGRLAVCGTVNDLAMAGAVPRYLTAGFVIEEGLPFEDLTRVVESMRRAADEASVQIVTGDTKVVDRGKGDGLYINTAGVGVVPEGVDVSPRNVRPGDAVLVSGDLGRHGIAVLSVREGLELEGPVGSDCAPLAGTVQALIEAGVDVRCLRDLTRGGLTAALNEIASAGVADIGIDEASLPVGEVVAGACELLGLDPLDVACEGRFVAFVSEESVERALEVLQAHAADGVAPARIGRVDRPPDSRPPRVTVESRIGAQRVLDVPTGEPLPRIC